MSRVFISHNHEDDPFVNRLVASLHQHGLKTFADHHDIHGGARWNEHVQRALDECQQMVAIVSERSIASKNCQDEWHTFMDEHKELIPLWLSGKMYFSFMTAIRVDFRDPDHYDDSVQELVGLLTDQKTQTIPTSNESVGRRQLHKDSGILPPGLGEVFPLARRPDKGIGIATGNVGKIGGADVLVNSENNLLDMDRPISKTVSGSLNAFSADWDEHDRIVRETVRLELATIGEKVGIPVAVGSAYSTGPGNLASNGVRYLVHSVSIARHRDEVTVGTPLQLARCVTSALIEVDRLTREYCPDNPLKHVVIPLFGVGDGGLPLELIVERLIERAIDYLEVQPTAIETTYFLAYRSPTRDILRATLESLTPDDLLSPTAQ